MAADREEIGRRVRAIQDALGISENALAALLRNKGLWPKCASGTVAAWKKGKISRKAADALAAVDPERRGVSWIMAIEGASPKAPKTPKSQADKEKIRAMRDLEVILSQGKPDWIDHIKQQLKLFAELSKRHEK